MLDGGRGRWSVVSGGADRGTLERESRRRTRPSVSRERKEGVREEMRSVL
jgi:hypothetical protein